ncbi:F-box protein PP2-B10-like [Carex rostrata]
MSILFTYAGAFTVVAGVLTIFIFLCTYAGAFSVITGLLTIFITAFVTDISSRIISRLNDNFKSFRSNREEPNRGQMFLARALQIEHSAVDVKWKWVPNKDLRFPEVAELLKVHWLEIKARINLDGFIPETNYAAHLIFKIKSNTCGLDTLQKASISMGGHKWKKIVCIKPRVARPRNKCIGLPVKRSDGWMEIELGQFYCNDGTGNQEVVISFKENNDNIKKSGLIIAGIEVRPIETAEHVAIVK